MWIMSDKLTHTERLQNNAFRGGHTGPLSKKEPEVEQVEIASGAFGYLRGIRDRADAIELRFRGGNSTWFSYNWLGAWQYDPSEGILLKFSGDLIYLVLIRGSNLDLPLNDGSINLTSGGLQRHRVVWIREMAEADIRQVGEKGPTIDSIEIAECESQAAVKEWLKNKAPAFVR